MHLAGCTDCQRRLAEFRLTRQQLAFLKDPGALDWRPDVAPRVTERIQRRRRLRGFGRRLISGAAGALAIGVVLVGVIWLAQRLSPMPSEEGSSASARHLLSHARWNPPCGGEASMNLDIAADKLVYPISVILNPVDAFGALSERDRRDNQLVIGEYAACEGATDFWLTSDDVKLDGDDLLVTVHLSGSPPRSAFWVRVYRAGEGRRLANKEVRLTTCDEALTVRFDGILDGLEDGYVLVQFDTEARRIESVYPQHNNTAIVPLP